jgi:hypothetical protein
MKTTLLSILLSLGLSSAAFADGIIFSCAATNNGESYGLIIYPDAHGFPLMHVYVDAGKGGPLVTDLTVSVEPSKGGYQSIVKDGVFSEAARLTPQGSGYFLILNSGFLGAYTFNAGECR